jgi:hypothetical protein
VDQYGRTIATPTVKWSATGGKITAEGLFTAGTTEGLHNVRAAAGDREAIAEVRVTAERRGETEIRDEEETWETGKRTIRWRGTVPPQKWMNFYTKVLTRFAASSDLKLELSFEIPIDREQAQSKLEETRSALKELGLDDSAASC